MNLTFVNSAQAKLHDTKIPKYIFFVDEFPMTGSGKIQKFKLKDIGLELCQKAWNRNYLIYIHGVKTGIMLSFNP